MTAIGALQSFARTLAANPSSSSLRVRDALVACATEATGKPAHFVDVGGALPAGTAIALAVEGRTFGTLVVAAAADGASVESCRVLADLAAAWMAREDADAKRIEKLRALGGMASGISHDLKNVFGPLLLQLDVIARKSDVDVAFLRERLEKMRRPLENGLHIVERLRSFSKRSASDEREIVDIGSVVDDAVGLCRPRVAGREVELVVEQGGAPAVRIEVADAVAAVASMIAAVIEKVKAKGAVHVSFGARDGGVVVDVAGAAAEPPVLARDFAVRHGGRVSRDTASTVSLWLPAAAPPHNA